MKALTRCAGLFLLCLITFNLSSSALPTYAAGQTPNDDYLIFLPVVFRDYCSQKNFFDDFTDQTSGWPVSEDGFLKTEYVSNEYSVITKRAGYLYLFRAPVCSFDHTVIEMDFRWSQKNKRGSDIGLLFGLVGNFDEFYFLDVNVDSRTMAVIRKDSSGFRLVTPIFHNMPLSRDGVNHLEVAKDAQYVTVYVNGFGINVFPYDVNWSGPSYAGFALSPYSNLPVIEIRIDNFSVMGGSGNTRNIPNVLDSASDLTSVIQFALKTVRVDRPASR